MNVGVLPNNVNEVISTEIINNGIIIPRTEKEKTITNIAYLFLKSPFLWTFGGLVASWFIFPLPASLALTATVVCGMATFPHQLPRLLHYEAAIIDGISREYLTRAGLLKHPYYNEIFPGVYLGALPLRNFYDENTLIKELNIKAVLTVVEDYELSTETLFSSAVQKSDWARQGVSVYHLSIEDMTSLSIEDLHKAADFIKEYENGVYVHCKAGRGRSVMCVMAYLIKYKDYSYEEAEKFVRSKRPIMNLRNWQKETLKDFSLEIQNAPDILDCYD